MKEKFLEKMSFDLALEVIKTGKELTKSQEYVLARQLVKSGTSIGANIHEAFGAYSKKEFKAKMSIAYKESRETKYWLRLIHATDQISEEKFSKLHELTDRLGGILYNLIKKTSE